jgi:branched-subunit amino acid aminotransferase/4-amino-4-deoxychorismate lyase
MAESTLYQFTGSELTPVTWCQPGHETVVVADSWRVVEGQAVGLEHHLDRFQRSVVTVAPEALPGLETFLQAALAAIPDTGEWFPRIECLTTPHGHVFRFYHREAPARLSTAVLAAALHDPRTQPLVKGPDLAALMALRQEVAPSGATEAVIFTPDGFIAEGAYSTLVVWPPGNREMWVVDADIPRIPSITEKVLVDVAHSQGITVVGKKMRSDTLSQHMVWVVSALHGIREATAWVSGPTIRSESAVARRWNRLLQEQRRPLGPKTSAT